MLKDFVYMLPGKISLRLQASPVWTLRCVLVWDILLCVSMPSVLI